MEQFVHLFDEEAPIITSLNCPADITLVPAADCSVDTSPNSTGSATGTAIDNCDASPALTLTYTDASFASGSMTIILRTWTMVAQDHCDNTSELSCDQVITVMGCDDPQTDDCDVEFTHELMSPGESPPGAGVTVATEDGIDLSFDDIVYGTGSTNFGSADIIPAQPEAGDGQVMWLNNITAVYDLSSVGAVDVVKFDFIDYGGGENLRINGALLIDDITDMNGAVLGGVNVLVAWNTYTGFKAGEVVLTGNVQELAVAGQEFYIDNVCVIEEPTCADTDADGICDADEIAGCATLRLQLQRERHDDDNVVYSDCSSARTSPTLTAITRVRHMAAKNPEPRWWCHLNSTPSPVGMWTSTPNNWPTRTSRRRTSTVLSSTTSFTLCSALGKRF